MKRRRSAVRIAIFAMLATALGTFGGANFGGRLAAQSQGLTPNASPQDDPNFPRIVNFPMPSISPIWPETEAVRPADASGYLPGYRILPNLIFAKDHSLGYYVGFNSQGSWIRHETGAVYVFNRARGTLTVGANSLAELPADLIRPKHGDENSFPRRVDGMITRNGNGTSTLTYELIEQGKPPRKMTFTGLAPAGKLGHWAWIGEPSQADPLALATITDDEKQRLQLSAPGEAPGSAGSVSVDSNGKVEWMFGTRIFIATYFAHGEHGKLTRNPDGTHQLSFTLVVPGKTDRRLNLSVARSKNIMNPLLENKLSTSYVGIGDACGARPSTANAAVLAAPPQLDPNDAWVWTGSNGKVPLSIMFNVQPDGWVRWNLVPGLSAQIFLAGPTPADWLKNGAAPSPSATPSRKKAPPLPQHGPTEDPNMPKLSAAKDSPYRTPVVWTYMDSTIPSVWITGPEAWVTWGRPPQAELVYLGFNEKGSWLESCDGGAIYTWNGANQYLTQVAVNMADVPLDLSNPSDFLRRYAAWEESGGAADASATSAGLKTRHYEQGNAISQNTASNDVDPFQAAGLVPGDTGPSTYSAPVGNSSGGTGAQVKNGQLTYKDSQSGATVSMKVQRPGFIAAQTQVLKSLGSSGTWIWLSDDRQQGRVINVTQDGAVTVTIVPAQTAISMLSAGTQH